MGRTGLGVWRDQAKKTKKEKELMDTDNSVVTVGWGGGGRV